MDKFV